MARPGDLLHVDIKPLGRIGQIGHRIHGDRRRATPGIGWEYVHVAVDDHTRLAYVEVLADQLGATCAAFLQRAVGWLQARGITTRRVMSDNGSGYVSRAWRTTCEALGLRHLRTRVYTPRTNGKAERFIQTLLREWAYVEPVRLLPDPSSDAPTLCAVLQPPATPREPWLPSSVVAAHERCVMNNVLELNT